MAYVAHDYARTPLTRGDLQAIAGGRPMRELVNPKSPSFRVLARDLAALTEADAAALILANPRILRRPILIAGRRRVVGFDEEAYARLT